MFTKFSSSIISIIVLLTVSFSAIASEPTYTTTNAEDYRLSKMRSDFAYLETYNIHELNKDPSWHHISKSVTSHVLFPHHLAYLETYGIYELENDPLWTACTR